MKKVVVILMSMVMLMSVAGCNNSEVEQLSEKLTELEKMQRLKDYQASLDKSKYSEISWYVVERVIDTYKADIEEATDKSGVDKAENEIKSEMDNLTYVKEEEIALKARTAYLQQKWYAEL